MPKSSYSLNPLSLLSEAYSFLWKQPALFHVLVWLLILPMILMDLLTMYWPVSDAASIQNIGSVGYVLASVIFTVLTFWGLACVLLVGRRMVINRAGRSRTSFKSVRRESVRLILPLFFTSLLRTAITIEWALLWAVPAIFFLLNSNSCRATFSPLLSSLGDTLNGASYDSLSVSFSIFFHYCGIGLLLLPLLIPAVIYQIRTAFFGVVLVSENLRYRDALRRSRDVIRGHTWTTIGVLLVLCLILFIPSAIISFGIQMLQRSLPPQAAAMSPVIDDVVYGISGLLFLLSLIAFYGRLSKEKGRVKQVFPDII